MYKVIKLKGNVASSGAFSGTVFRLDNMDISNLKNSDLPQKPIFICNGRLTVSELGRLPSPCAVLAGGGGNTSEDYNYMASGGRWNEIIIFANAVRGDLDELSDYMEVTVSMKDNGNIEVYEKILNKEPTIDSKGIPFSTEEDEKVVASLDELNEILLKTKKPSEIMKLARQIVSYANSDSVDEKYRVGELLSKAISLNEKCVGILVELTRSKDRQVRFTAARCMSKLVEKNPELIPEEGIRALLDKDMDDRSIPNLVIRAMGKGKHHSHINDTINAFINEKIYDNIIRQVQSFENDNHPKDFYKSK